MKAKGRKRTEEKKCKLRQGIFIDVGYKAVLVVLLG
jgi:hypothetical protein